jgi:hypothetical protein
MSGGTTSEELGRWEYNIGMDGKVWNEFFWLWIGTSGGLL